MYLIPAVAGSDSYSVAKVIFSETSDSIGVDIADEATGRRRADLPFQARHTCQPGKRFEAD
jgi:hypothetical protein